MLQKTFTEDFITGKKSKNVGQRNKYYIKDSHPVIVSAKVFDKVQEEMAKRSRFVNNGGGTVKANRGKYNGKYLLGNLLVCGGCGTSYRRRTERGKVVWRCATRIEKGKEIYANSPTLNEEWIKKILGQMYCEGGSYAESVIRDKVNEIQVFNSCIMISFKDGQRFVWMQEESRNNLSYSIESWYNE